MTNKHTPGPWVASPESNGLEWNIDSGPWGVAICAFAPGEGSAEANARLIAAAPELLDSLQEMLDLLELMSPFDGPQQRKARSIIAKATGVQP